MNNEELLIRNTTVAQRVKIVNEALGLDSVDCEGVPQSMIDMYDDYINGKKEIAEINASFKTEYVMGDDSARPEKGGCGMGMF
ncbi:hypothetical protein SAMN06296386_1236 [Lachnospiraceae bacterium]|nr:hypothetical protein SAMN06296386_1236 [Lachnospiraceae bacterium]